MRPWPGVFMYDDCMLLEYRMMYAAPNLRRLV